MKLSILRPLGLNVLLLVPVAFTLNGAGESSPPRNAGQQNHLSGLTAKITFPSGSVRIVKLEGVGCSRSICSRTLLKAKTPSDPLVTLWLDSIAAIQDTTADDALFILKNGAERRISLIADFRVLYIADRSGGIGKLDLARVKSVEFLAPPR